MRLHSAAGYAWVQLISDGLSRALGVSQLSPRDATAMTGLCFSSSIGLHGFVEMVVVEFQRSRQKHTRFPTWGKRPPIWFSPVWQVFLCLFGLGFDVKFHGPSVLLDLQFSSHCLPSATTCRMSKILAFLVPYYKILYQGSVEFRLVIFDHSKADHLFARKVHTHPIVKPLRKDAW